MVLLNSSKIKNVMAKVLPKDNFFPKHSFKYGKKHYVGWLFLVFEVRCYSCFEVSLSFCFIKIIFYSYFNISQDFNFKLKIYTLEYCLQRHLALDMTTRKVCLTVVQTMVQFVAKLVAELVELAVRPVELADQVEPVIDEVLK